MQCAAFGGSAWDHLRRSLDAQGRRHPQAVKTLTSPHKCAQILAGYSLDGTAQVDYATLSFIAPAWCLLQARICLSGVLAVLRGEGV